MRAVVGRSIIIFITVLSISTASNFTMGLPHTPPPHDIQDKSSPQHLNPPFESTLNQSSEKVQPSGVDMPDTRSDNNSFQPLYSNSSLSVPILIDGPLDPLSSSLPTYLVGENDLPGEEVEEDPLLEILVTSVQELYSSFRQDAKYHMEEEHTQLSNRFTSHVQHLESQFQREIEHIREDYSLRVEQLKNQISIQRSEDIKSLNENLSFLQKTQEESVEGLKKELQSLQLRTETFSKDQANMTSRISSLTATMEKFTLKLKELEKKQREDISTLEKTGKGLSITIDMIETELKRLGTGLEETESALENLQKAAEKDQRQLRRTMIREQKQEPIQNCIRHLKNNNVRGAVKQWKAIVEITDDLTSTLSTDMARIIDEAYGRNTGNLLKVVEFIHRCVARADRRLREEAYGYLVQEMEAARHLSDEKNMPNVLTLAYVMKSDLQEYYNTSSSSLEILSKLPKTLKLIVFEKVKLVLTGVGMLRAGLDDKVVLIPKDSRFHLQGEVIWEFEYDRGIFYIRNVHTQKYLQIVHDGFNAYGFAKQELILSKHKKQQGTAFRMFGLTSQTLLIKSIVHNGFLTWKSNIQTIYGDDDSYFVLLSDPNNGPKPYWHVEHAN